MKTIKTDWETLPEDIWNLILDKLESSKDLLRCGVVCHKWHDLTRNYKRRFNLLHQVPMLIVPDEENKLNIFDPANNNRKLVKPELVIPDDMRICGSSIGWLISINRDMSVTLFKPFDKERVELRVDYLELDLQEDIESDPVFFEYFERCHIDVRLWISADPIENPDDYVIVLASSEHHNLAFTRPGRDTDWIQLTAHIKNFYGVVFDDDNLGFHALADHGALAHISLFDLEVKWVVWVRQLPESPSTTNRYLVKSHDGVLYRVDRVLLGSCSGQRETKITRVFKLLVEDEGEPSWVTVKTLGGASLFLGDNSSIYVRASDFAGCRPNCIYLTDDFEKRGHRLPGPYRLDLCVYCLDDESYTRHYRQILPNFVDGMKVQLPIWVTPTPS